MSGWDGTDALETQSNLCGYHAFISYFFDGLTSLTSLPNVARSQPSISPFKLTSDISVDRFSPHVIASEFRRLGMT